MGIVLGVFGTIVVQAIGAAGGSSLSNPSPAVTILSAVVFDLGFVIAALYFAVVRGHGHPADFGFRPVALKLALVAIVIAAVSYYTATAIWAALFNLHGSDKLPSDFGVDRSTVALIGTAAFVCVIAPMAEEFFFRGFFFGALRRWRIKVAGREIGTWVAAVVTGILFGLAHTGSASPSTWSRWDSSGSCCASCAGAPARCIRAWRFTRSTIHSRWASTRWAGMPARWSR